MGKREDAKALGVKKEASPEELKQAFRSAAFRCHPDLAGEASRDEFIRLCEAYERLRDGHWDRAPVEEVAPRRGNGRKRAATHSADFATIFDDLLSNDVAAGNGRHILDHIELEVPLDYLIFGATVSIHFPVEAACRACAGQGLRVAGQGVVERCPTCWGTGNIERQLRVPLSIPPGLRSGAVLRVPLDHAALPGFDLLVELSLAR